MEVKNETETDFPETVTFGSNEVIVITGGSGFLGQHIVRVIQEKAKGIKEIRVIDVIPYKKKLEFNDNFPIEYYKGDITIEDDLDKPFDGATCVIHTAAVVSIGHFVDRYHMRSVNMIGTSNIIVKCRQWSIPSLVITSTVDAVFQIDSEFFNESESDFDIPMDEDLILMGYYGFTKAQSEAQVLCSRSLPLLNGKRLRSVILRPTVLYGELDPHYVPAAMKVAKTCGGYLIKPKIFTDEPVLQSTYAGNAAWAHVLAAWHLRIEELKASEMKNTLVEPLDHEVDGETFYVNDDTKPSIIYDFMKPFLLLKGFKTMTIPIPLFLILFSMKWMSWMVQNIFPISWKKTLNQYPIFPTYESFLMAHSHVQFSRQKATDYLHYKPIYSEEVAKANSAKYYRDIAI